MLKNGGLNSDSDFEYVVPLNMNNKKLIVVKEAVSIRIETKWSKSVLAYIFCNRLHIIISRHLLQEQSKKVNHDISCGKHFQIRGIRRFKGLSGCLNLNTMVQTLEEAIPVSKLGAFPSFGRSYRASKSKMKELDLLPFQRELQLDFSNQRIGDSHYKSNLIGKIYHLSD